MGRTLRVLHVEDRERDVALLTRHLVRAGYELVSERVDTPEAMRAALAGGEWDVILCDYSMPQFGALEALALLGETGLDIPFIIISGTIGEEIAVGAMRAGAHDYLMKDRLARLAPAIERELQEAANRRARRQAEEALRASEAELRALFAAMTDTIFVLDAGGRLLKVSPRRLARSGLAADELVGRTLHELLPAEKADFFIGLVRQVLAEGRTHRAEYGLKLGGKDWWFDTNVSPVTESTAILVARDITERKRAEEAQAQLNAQLESERRRLDNIVGTVPGVVWESWFEPDPAAGRTGFVNDYVETVIGYSKEEWLSTANFWYSIMPPEDRDRVSRLIAEHVSAGRKPPLLEFRWVAKDGRVIWVESRSTPITDDAGRIVGVRGVTIDATERKRAEDELRKSEERFHLAAHASGGAVYDFDLGAGRVWWSEGFSSLFGYPPEAVRPELEWWAGLIHPDDRQRVEASLDTAIRGAARDWAEEYRLRRAGGQYAYVLDSGYFVRDPAGRAVRMVGMVSDLTERQVREERLRRQNETLAWLAKGRTGGGASEALRDVTEAAAHALEVARASVWVYSDDMSEIRCLDLYEREAGRHSEGYVLRREQYPSYFEALATNPTIVADDAHAHPATREFSSDYLTPLGVTSMLDAPVRVGGRVVGVICHEHVGPRRGWLLDEQIFASAAADSLSLLMEAERREQAEEELRRSEERYRDIVENARDIIYTHDLEGNYLSVNKAGEQITGYTREESLRMNLAQSVAPEYREKARRMFAAKLAGDMETVYDLELVTKDGGRVSVEVNTRLVYQNGEPAGVQGIARDITERKRVEEMQRSRAAMAALRADINAALADSGTPLRLILERCAEALVRHLDAACARIWTLNRGVGLLEPQAGAGVCPQADGPDARGRVGVIAAARRPHVTNDVQGDPFVGDPEWATREGITAFAGYPMLVEDRVIGVMSMFSRQKLADETLDALSAAADTISQGIERRRAEEELRASEEQLRQSQKLEAVGQLAGGVAHDFNNLLTVINGYSDLLLRQLGQGEPARLKVEEIKRAGERAASLTRQLLAFSRNQVLQPVVLSLNAVVTDVDRMLRRLIGEDIDIVTVLDPALGHVRADPGQIEQVILNLAVNARDAMPQGGKLTVETANVYLDSEYAGHHLAVRPGHFAMLAVSDTGYGMTAETQARIFEPFFTTKEKGKGTGLGLSTVYGIVKQSGGNIWVYSEVGRGTAFKVYLPLVDEPAESAEVEADEAPRGREALLLVEDEEQVRRMAREILEMSGYEVLEAAGGEEALALFEERGDAVDLVMTDVVMPGMSGPELAQQVAALRPGVRVLYMSGYTDDAVVRHGLLDQEISFLQKPFTADALMRKVREVLDAPGKG